MSEFQDYLKRLDRQRPEVKRIRDGAKARGDLTTVRNADKLLVEWSALIATHTPVNDRHPPLRKLSPSVLAAAIANPKRQLRRFRRSISRPTSFRISVISTIR